MPESDRVWLLLGSNQPVGPVSSGHIALQVSAGRLPSKTLVWRPGMASWVSAAEGAEIKNRCAPPIPSPDVPLPLPPLGSTASRQDQLARVASHCCEDDLPGALRSVCPRVGLPHHSRNHHQPSGKRFVARDGLPGRETDDA